ncbi:MAG: SDR family NAD(P)-dependent oxidoreductase, partial [Planctomycetota bacterium]
GDRVVGYACSVADFENCQRLVNFALHRFGRLDLLVNNAGISMEGDISEMHPLVINDVIDTNVKGSMYLTRAATQSLIQTNGGIVFVNSCAAYQGIPGYSIYCASKAALQSFADAVRLELEPKNVFVGNMFVGFTKNDQEKKILSPSGRWKPQPQRDFVHQHSQDGVAAAIVEMYRQRIPEKTLTSLGILSKWLNRVAPVLPKLFLKRHYQRSIQHSNGKLSADSMVNDRSRAAFD